MPELKADQFPEGQARSRQFGQLDAVFAQHTREVLEGLGCTADQIPSMAQAGVT